MSYETRYAAMKTAQLDAAANSPAAVAWRLRDNAARAQAGREQSELFPMPAATAEPVEWLEWYMKSAEWFNQRVRELRGD